MLREAAHEGKPSAQRRTPGLYLRLRSTEKVTMDPAVAIWRAPVIGWAAA